MKRIVMVVLLFTVMCHAKNKKNKNEVLDPPAYPYTGKVVNEITVRHYDYESHISTQAGSADAYCDVTPTAAYCSDSNVMRFSQILLEGEDEDSKAAFSHQKRTPLILADQSTEDSCSSLFTSELNTETLVRTDLCDPIHNLEETARENAKIVSSNPRWGTMRGEVMFKYRLLTSPIQKWILPWLAHDYHEYYCLSIGSPKLDINKKAKYAEACYLK